MGAAIVDPKEQALSHLEQATAAAESLSGDHVAEKQILVHLAVAGISSILYVAETIKLSLRDIVYELRD